MSQSMVWYQLQDADMGCQNSAIDPLMQSDTVDVNSMSIFDTLKPCSKSVIVTTENNSTKACKSTSGSANPSNLSDCLPPPALRGLAYGDGFFTTIAVDKGQPLWQSYHKARLQSHCEALRLTLDWNVEAQLWQAIVKLAREAINGVIKIIVTRQEQSLRGYAYDPEPSNNACKIWIGVIKGQPLATHTATFVTPLDDLNPSFSHHSLNNALNNPLNNALDNALQNPQPSLGTHASDTVNGDLEEVILQQTPITAICLNSRLSSLPEPLAGLKTLNRLDSVMVAGELEQLKSQNPNLAEGLVRDLSGNWVEGVMSNVFYQLNPSSPPDRVSDSQWYTPPIISAGVRGVMRQVIIDKMATTSLPVQQRVLQDSDLIQLKALFFCNAVRGVIPVQTLIVDGQLMQLSLESFKTISVPI